MQRGRLSKTDGQLLVLSESPCRRYARGTQSLFDNYAMLTIKQNNRPNRTIQLWDCALYVAMAGIWTMLGPCKQSLMIASEDSQADDYCKPETISRDTSAGRELHIQLTIAE